MDSQLIRRFNIFFGPMILPIIVLGITCSSATSAGQDNGVTVEAMPTGPMDAEYLRALMAEEQEPTQDDEADDANAASNQASEAAPEEPTETLPTPPMPLALPPPPPAPVRFTLQNGLTVVLQRIPDRNFAAAMLCYRVGRRHDPEGYHGLAHLTEHTMFTGTDTVNELEFHLRLDAAGAVINNAGTEPDTTRYYSYLPADQIDWFLWRESQRMARLLSGLNSRRLNRQREIVIDEGIERGHSTWFGRRYALLWHLALPTGHPYSQLDEDIDDVRAIRVRDIQWFFQTYYAPDNATLSIVGGINPDQLRPVIERHFGPIRRSGPQSTEPTTPPVTPLDTTLQVRFEVPVDASRKLFIAWPTPALREEGDAALDIASWVLRHPHDNSLERELQSLGLASEVTFAQWSQELNSLFVIEIHPLEGSPTSEIMTVVNRHLQTLSNDALTREQFQQAREQQVADQQMEGENLLRRARLLSHATANTPLITNEEEVERYEAVTFESFQQTIRRWLPVDRRLELEVTYDPHAPLQGRVIHLNPRTSTETP